MSLANVSQKDRCWTSWLAKYRPLLHVSPMPRLRVWHTRVKTHLWESDAESKVKHGVWDPMLELTMTSPYVDANTCTTGQPHASVDLKRFFSWVFFLNHLPPSPENNIRVISNFSENLRRYSQVKVHHRCQLRRCTLSCDYLRKFSKKIRNGPNGILRGLGETKSWKIPEVKNLVALSL